jgi:hypothetical protein
MTYQPTGEEIMFLTAICSLLQLVVSQFQSYQAAKADHLLIWLLNYSYKSLTKVNGGYDHANLLLLSSHLFPKDTSFRVASL